MSDVDVVQTSQSVSASTSVLGDFLSNPYFNAGFGLIGIGAGLAVARRGFLESIALLRRHLLVTLEIPSHDHSHAWFLHWMAKHQKSTSSRIARSHHLAVETTFKQHENGSAVTSIDLVPGPGRHLLQWRGVWIQMQRQRNTRMVDIKKGSPWESVTLTTLSRDRHVFAELLNEARQMAIESQEGKTVIFTCWGLEWRQFGQPRRKRALSSVILDRGVKERIVSDVRDFLGSSQYYYERGIPYRRGYLLHGPPGSGKTSFIQALAGDLDYNLCILNLSERGLTDDRLHLILSIIPERCIMVLEDIDTAFSGRQPSDEKGFQSSITLSGFLNALDGVVASEERIVFMTTNHPERLDPALLRPGRVDLKEYLGHATHFQMKEMFVRFYGGSEDNAEEFATLLSSSNLHISTAYLQGLFVSNKGDPEGARREAKKAIAPTKKTPSIVKVPEMSKAKKGCVRQTNLQKTETVPT